MIDAAIDRDGVLGCSCPGCKVHPRKLCPLRTLPAGTDHYAVLTPHHGKAGANDHHLSNISAWCQPCNRAVGKVPTEGSTQHQREKKSRLRPSAPAGGPTPRTYEQEKREELLPLATRYAIKKVKEGRKRLNDLLRRSEEDVAADESRELLLAAAGLKYGALVNGLSGEFGISQETAYSWAAVMAKNPINGFLWEPDSPRGKLLDFIDTSYHDLTVEQIYARHPATGRSRTQWGERLE